MTQDELRAMGPPVSAFPFDSNIMMAVEAQELQRLVPQFYAPDELKMEPFLRARDPGVMPNEVTFTLPEITFLWFETPTGVEPTLSFPEFVKGVSCAALAVDVDHLQFVKDITVATARKVSEGGNLPRIDIAFADVIRSNLATTFANNEPMSWRSLMAFTLGAYWLLGFIIEPTRRVGKQVPAEFVRGFIDHYAALGYLPT